MSENIHQNCENYNPKKDFCLKWFESSSNGNQKRGRRMTEKQFVAVDDDLVADTKHERLMNNLVVADMLNCFIKENKQLNNELITLQLQDNDRKKYQKQLEKENRQLKQEIGNLEHTKDFCADVCADCERLEKENEQLKALIKKTLETTPIEHTLAVELKNSVRELYD